MSASREQDRLTVREASALLGVSGATLRNWRRAGHITPVVAKPLMFAKSSVLCLRKRIADSSFKRLHSRANKTASAQAAALDAPEPLLSASALELAAAARRVSPDTDAIMWVAALVRLERANEVELAYANDAIRTEAWKRDSLARIMEAWRRRLKTFASDRLAATLSDFASWCETAEDALGLLYQALTMTGQRSRKGAFFTPPKLIDESLDALGPAPDTFLDPCCGSGRYLLRAAKRLGVPPEGLYGFDSDPVSADLARVNIMLAHRGWNGTPEIHCLDSLREAKRDERNQSVERIRGRVKAIAANPPWGGQVKTPPVGRSRIRSGETFSLFLEKAIDFLAEGGRLSFLLPESILSTRVHADIRRVVLEKTRIRRIARLGRCFAGVFTPVVRLDLEKKKPSASHAVHITGPGGGHFVEQGCYARNRDHVFDVETTKADRECIDALFARPHLTLKDNAAWALGIVTGDNENLILPEPARGAEPIVRGRDVHPYVVEQPKAFVRFTPAAFQQTAPESLYRSPEKLIYRFIANRLVFAYDAAGMLTLNSANIVVPRIPGHSVKTCLAFLNSSLFQYLFAKKYGVRKILRRDLETLPFPPVSAAMKRKLETAVDKRLAGRREAEAEADSLVWQAFRLDGETARVVRKRVGDGGAFRK